MLNERLAAQWFMRLGHTAHPGRTPACQNHSGGIKFNNNPNMKRIFLTEEWEGYPLRKDYEDEINMVIK